MRAFRIVKTKYVQSCLDGEGAKLWGGRWNSRGRPAVYLGTTVSLCLLELLVHVADIGLLRSAYMILELSVPDELVAVLEPAKLPTDWAAPEHPECKRLGNEWLEAGNSAGLLVPSAVVPMENNLLLNPGHPGFRQVKVFDPRAVSFDSRLLTRQP